MDGRKAVVGELREKVILACFQILSNQASERDGENYGIL